MDTLFQIVTMMIPKAGIQVGGAPLTLNVFLLLCVILKNPNQTVLAVQRIKGMGFLYAVLLLFGSMTFLLGIGHWPLYRLAQIAIVIISPLAIVAMLRMDAEISMKITCVALIVVNIYGIVQFVHGIVSSSIPGLTYTYGQDLTGKNIGYGVGGDDLANKIVSTYQNGNYLGLFCIQGICLMFIWCAKEGIWKRLRFLSIILGFVGLLLCGSRSAVIPFAAICGALAVQRFRAWPKRMKMTYFIISILAIFVSIEVLFTFYGHVLQRFYERIIVSTSQDPTGAGRTIQWLSIFRGVSSLDLPNLLRVFFFGQSASMQLGGEGMPEFLITLGVPSAFAFYGMIVLAIFYFWRKKGFRSISYGLICVFAAFSLDQSFYYPPNVMETFMCIGIAMSYMRSRNEVSSRIS